MASLVNTNEVQATENSISKDDEAYLHAMQVCSSFIINPVVKAAVDLDLFGIIAKEGPAGCLSASQIASHLQTKNPNAIYALDQMLRLLASHSLLTSSLRTLDDGKAEILYGIAPAGEFLLKNEDGVSIAEHVHFSSYRNVMEMCYYLKDAVLEGGIAYCKANKMSVFEYMEKDHSFGQTFDKAMSNSSNMVLKKILQTYKGFEGLKTLVDVGGGIGTTLNLIVSKYSSISGINFDLPRAIEKAPSYNNGIEHVAGDMFVEIPKGDAILMKRILHDWSDEQCLIILKNCYSALPQTGKVIVVDAILSRSPETSSLAKFNAQLSNLMYAQLGGKERTEQEFEVLAKGAGFSSIQIQCRVYGHWVIEFYK